MRKLILAILCLSSFSYAVKYDPMQGEMLSLSCAACHGTDGKSNTIIPYLAGIEKDTIYQSLLDYKYGKRNGTIMQKHVKGFTDDQLEQIAYYFSKVQK